MFHGIVHFSVVFLIFMAMLMLTQPFPRLEPPTPTHPAGGNSYMRNFFSFFFVSRGLLTLQLNLSIAPVDWVNRLRRTTPSSCLESCRSVCPFSVNLRKACIPIRYGRPMHLILLAGVQPLYYRGSYCCKDQNPHGGAKSQVCPYTAPAHLGSGVGWVNVLTRQREQHSGLLLQRERRVKWARHT